MGVGLVLSAAFLLGPVRHVIAAQSWRAQECSVIRSGVRRYPRSKGSDGFSPKIFYSYAVEGSEHHSDTYDFFEYSASGWEAAQQIASRYPPGLTVPCYVNPSDPDDATLHRGPSLSWLAGIFPLAALAGGLALWPR